MIFGIEQKYIIEDVTNERIVATKIMFTNQGTDVVFINDVTMLAGDIFKIDIEAPHMVDFSFSIRFEPATVIVAGDGISSGSKLLLTTMKPKG